MMTFIRQKTALIRVSFAIVFVIASCWQGNVFADEVKQVRYGVIEGLRPTKISKGLFGMRDTSGTAYTIRLVATSARLEVDSPNLSFLVGDCVAVVGEGDKTTLSRTQSQLCVIKPKATLNPARKGHVNSLKAYGPNSAECAHARSEANAWTPGFGRRRALLREMVICAKPSVSTNSYKTTAQQSCGDAWKKVERLPFGPARANARETARKICANMQ